MNIRKNIDYSTMFDAMRVAMSTDMSQSKLYYELGRLICQRTEKGAAVAAAAMGGCIVFSTSAPYGGGGGGGSCCMHGYNELLYGS